MEDWELKNQENKVREAYMRLFLGDNKELKPDAEIVLRDLRTYCRASGIIGYRTTEGAIDPLAMANANGRREVWDRLLEFLYLPDRKIVELKLPRINAYE